MPSFDIVSEVDTQALDNAINTATREVATRYDLKDSKSTIELDKKNMTIQIVTGSDMYMNSIEQIITSKLLKQKIDPSCLDMGKEEYAAGDMMRKDITILKGIEREFAKKIVKTIKESKLKVQVQIMDEQVRVTSKSINDLQAVISLCKSAGFERPLQYVNMK